MSNASPSQQPSSSPSNQPVELTGYACGGQVLRAALTLSAATGRSFILRELRAGSAKPGLLRRHLTTVRAMAQICDAHTSGATLGSTELMFAPGVLKGGSFDWAMGAAGNLNLLLQTALPALALAPAPATITVTGGTHTPSGPSFPFLAESWAQQLRAMGADVDVHLQRWGFFPAGRGKVTARIAPAKLRPLSLLHRGVVNRVGATAAVAIISPKTARMQLRSVANALSEAQHRHGWPDFPALQQQTHGVRGSAGPGNIVWLQAHTDAVSAVFSAVVDTTARPVPADEVEAKITDRLAATLIAAAETWLESDAPVEPHLAAALVVPMALAGGGRFITSAPSEQLHRLLEVVGRFLPVSTSREVTRASGAICVAIVAL